MKTKMFYSDYNPETGQSTLGICNRYGTFYGVALCHPEEENESSFVGCRYAEVRAHIEYNKYRLELVRHQLKGLEDFEKILKNKWDYREDSMECKQLRKRIYHLRKEEENRKELIKNMKKALKKSMDERDLWWEKYNKKKNVK